MRVAMRVGIAGLILLAALATPALHGSAGYPAVRDQNNVVWASARPEAADGPAVTALSPASAAAGGPEMVLTVNGSGFVAGSAVRWNGSERVTTFLSATQLSAAIPASDVSAPGNVAVSVTNPGGGVSNDFNLSVYARSGLDALADTVLGQPGFSARTINNPLMAGGANRLNGAGGLAIDPKSGRLFVSDTYNHRILSWPNVQALANSQAADLVLGQANFDSILPNGGNLSASSLHEPRGLALDGAGNLYVADWANHRVLEYNAPITSSAAAARVFGQADFTSYGANRNGGPAANTLYGPTDVAVDSAGNLYVSDGGNSRVLEYDAPLSSDGVADRVFGAPNFGYNDPITCGVNAACLYYPEGILLDGADNLYVADRHNNRVLEYDAPLSSDAVADRVFGQPDFTSATPNNGGLSASSLNVPWGLAMDAFGSLYVADLGNNRLLVYTNPLTSDAAADRVFGQPDLISNAQNNGGISAAGLYNPTYVSLEAQGNLYISNDMNNRFLEFDAPARKAAYLPIAAR